MSARRIVYFCPAVATPTGGIKVIYRHVERLNRMQVSAYVCHPTDTAFRCTWFTSDVPFLANAAELGPSDLVVLPEIWAAEGAAQLRARGIPHAIFVQNGYITNPCLEGQTAENLAAAYEGAELVLVISEDSARMVRLNYPHLAPERLVVVAAAIPGIFQGGAGEDRERLISFMPRRMPDHVARVLFALTRQLPAQWGMVPIENADEGACANLLRHSRIFLSFADCEGLSLPPAEAALAGNVVVGYTGQAGREYWRAPNFRAVEQGDIAGFVAATVAAARAIDEGRLDLARLRPGIADLAARFSAEAEETRLAVIRQRAGL